MFRFFRKSSEPKKKNPAPQITEDTVRKEITVRGEVQNVGFRFFAQQAAKHQGVTGWVRNNDNSSVTMEIQGTEEQIAAVFAEIKRQPQIVIAGKEERYLPVDMKEKSFRIQDGY